MRTYKTLATSLVLASVLLLTGMARTAQASTITFNFTATQVTNTSSTLGGIAAVFDPFTTISGTFAYDTAIPPFNSSTSGAAYNTGTLTVSGVDLTPFLYFAPTITSVINPDGTGSDDLDQILSIQSRPATFPVGLYAEYRLYFYDFTGSALNSVALPTSIPLANFAFHGLAFTTTNVFQANACCLSETVSYNLTSFAAVQPPAPVPEPATLTLLGLGLLGLGVARRRRRLAARP